MGGGWWLAIGVPTRVVDVLADVTSTPTPRCTRRYLQPRWGGVLVLRDSVVLALTLGGARAQTVLLHYHSLNLLHLFLDLHAHATKASPARRLAIPSGVDRRVHSGCRVVPAAGMLFVRQPYPGPREASPQLDVRIPGRSQLPVLGPRRLQLLREEHEAEGPPGQGRHERGRWQGCHLQRHRHRPRVHVGVQLQHRQARQREARCQGRRPSVPRT